LDNKIDSLEDPSYIDPQAQDLMLLDVSEQDVETTIAQNLSDINSREVIYLSKVQTEPQPSCFGIVYGNNGRLFVDLLVRIKPTHQYTTVIFLVDTGSPTIFLSGKTVSALLPTDSTVTTSFKADIHGVWLSGVNISPPTSHFSDINVLGQPFFLRAAAILNVNYKNLTLTINW